MWLMNLNLNSLLWLVANLLDSAAPDPSPYVGRTERLLSPSLADKSTSALISCLTRRPVEDCSVKRMHPYKSF